MTAVPGGFFTGLDAVRHAVLADASFRATTYSYGARVLAVQVRPGDEHLLPAGGLVALPGADPAVQVFVLDAGDLAPVELPPPELRGTQSALFASPAAGWLAVVSADGRRIVALDVDRRVVLYAPGRRVWPRERAEFLRDVVHWCAVLDGNVVIHAGAIARDGRALLVAGAGNAGKSTLVRACLGAGFDVLGDNVVEVSIGASGAATLHPIFPTFKVRPDPVLPIPASWPQPEWDDMVSKHIFFLAEHLGEAFRGGGVPVAGTLVLDERGPGRIEPIATAAALFQVAPNTVAEFPYFSQQVLRRSGALLRSAPAWTAGRLPLEAIPGMLDTLLSDAAHVG